MATQTLKARVVRVHRTGLHLEIQGSGAAGWLPSAEWDYDPAAWKKALHNVRQGEVVEVVEWGRSFGKTQSAYSRRRVSEDPWRTITDDVLGSPMFFSVTRLTREWAIGDIWPGLQGRVFRKEYREYIENSSKAKDWKSHGEILLDDTVGGLVREIRRPGEFPEPELVLDSAKMFARLNQGEVIDTRDEGGLIKASVASVGWLASSPLTHDIEMVLLIDNDHEFVGSIKQLLGENGYDVTAATSVREAEATLAKFAKDTLDLALIDVHLLQRNGFHDGLDVARAVQQAQPHCCIVIVSAEQIHDFEEDDVNRKIHQAGDLHVSGYIAKPFTGNELLEKVALIQRQKPRPLVDILHELRSDVTQVSFVPAATPKRRSGNGEVLSGLVQDLQSAVDGSVVHIFEMDPVSGVTYSIANAGEGLQWKQVRHKLHKSPVGDTAVRGRREIWSDHDVTETPRLVGQHFWLRKAMNYRSAVGVPIETVATRGYCLIALHPQKEAFDEFFVLRATLCAEKAARHLEWRWVMKYSEERSHYETAGMSMVLMAHELQTKLSSLDARVFRLAKKLRADPTSEQLQIANDLVQEVGRQSESAIRLTRTLAGVQAETNLESIQVAEVVQEALKAIPDHVPDTIAVELLHQKDLSEVRVRGHRPSLFIAIFNIVLNAVQQMALFVRQQGTIRVIWKTVTQSGSDWVMIDVHDTGPGIHGALRERIFELGFSTRHDGTGVGLHVCRRNCLRIVDGQRTGTIVLADSKLNVGSTFRLQLPMTRERNDA